MPGAAATRPEANPVLDALDRRIVLATQDGLPLTPRPFHTVADVLNVPATEVVARMRRMLASGVIRRIAAVPNHYALGYRANGMSVWDVPDAAVNEAGQRIGALPFVSHCYRRPRHLPMWPYNLFAMVHGQGRKEVESRVHQIAEQLADQMGEQLGAHEVLYSTRILKKTGLRLRPGG